MSGQVVYIHIAPQAGSAPVAVSEVYAEAGVGLRGDRYALQAGTWTETPGSGREVTLIESEAIEALAAETGIVLAPGESRRNITTRGAALNDLVGADFRVGEVVLRGTRLCEPCDYLQRQTGRDGLTRGLLHRGGLRCEIVSGGTIQVGDPIMVG